MVQLDHELLSEGREGVVVRVYGQGWKGALGQGAQGGNSMNRILIY